MIHCVLFIIHIVLMRCSRLCVFGLLPYDMFHDVFELLLWYSWDAQWCILLSFPYYLWVVPKSTSHHFHNIYEMFQGLFFITPYDSLDVTWCILIIPTFIQELFHGVFRLFAYHPWDIPRCILNSSHSLLGCSMMCF